VAIVGIIVFAVVRCNADPGVYATASAAAADLNSHHFDGFGPTWSDVSAAVDRHLPQTWVKGRGYVDEALSVEPVGDDGYEVSYDGRYPACITVPPATGFGEYQGYVSAKDGAC
jgi:hypothetical protein